MNFDEINIKQTGKEYEVLMRQLFPNVKSKQYGCNSDLMVCLIDTEMSRYDKERFQKPYRKPSLSKQVEKIKSNIFIGISRLKKQQITEDGLNTLLNIENDLEYVQSFRSIMQILKRLSNL